MNRRDFLRRAAGAAAAAAVPAAVVEQSKASPQEWASRGETLVARGHGPDGRNDRDYLQGIIDGQLAAGLNVIRIPAGTFYLPAGGLIVERSVEIRGAA